MAKTQTTVRPRLSYDSELSWMSAASVQEARTARLAPVKAKEICVSRQAESRNVQMSNTRTRLVRTKTTTRHPFNPVNASPRVRRVPSSRSLLAPASRCQPPAQNPQKSLPPVPLTSSTRHPPKAHSSRAPSVPALAIPRQRPQVSSTPRLRGPPNSPAVRSPVTSSRKRSTARRPRDWPSSPSRSAAESTSHGKVEMPTRRQPIRNSRSLPTLASLRTHWYDSIGEAPAQVAAEKRLKDSVTRAAEDTPWQDYDIPQELEQVSCDTPEAICNIVQESLDEHRAIKASRLHAQAIVVRTTITQSRSCSDVDRELVQAESSAMASHGLSHRKSHRLSHRRAKSSMSSDMSSAPSLVHGSNTTPDSSNEDSGYLEPPHALGLSEAMSSQDSLVSNVSSGHFALGKSRWKQTKRDALVWLFPGRKPRDLVSAEEMEQSECTSCFDEIPARKAVNLPCKHNYCGPCLSQLVIIAIKSEDTFPPKCCLQEIPRNILRQHLSPLHLMALDQKSLEYAVAIGNRWYCARPECAKWLDIRSAHTSIGALKCGYCESYMCSFCRGPRHSMSEDCPHDLALDATLEEAEQAGWQRCYSCRAMVELNTGCRHITCKCSAEFW